MIALGKDNASYLKTDNHVDEIDILFQDCMCNLGDVYNYVTSKEQNIKLKKLLKCSPCMLFCKKYNIQVFKNSRNANDIYIDFCNRDESRLEENLKDFKSRLFEERKHLITFKRAVLKEIHQIELESSVLNSMIV